MRINQNTILNYINNPQLFEDKEKEEIRNELARQGIQQEREKQYYIKEIERLNKGLEYMKLYWSNREEYEKNELLNQIRDKDTSIEWLERAIEEEKKRERLH